MEINLTSNLFPQDEYSQRILHERANAIAQSRGEVVELSNKIDYIRFCLGENEYYGIPYEYAKEVMHNAVITKLPCVPKYIAGIINRRGALISILDLKQFFHTQGTEYEKTPTVIIISCKGMSLGILVDKIDGSQKFDPTTLDVAIPSDGVSKPEYILGLHQGTTTLINLENIVRDQLLQVKN